MKGYYGMKHPKKVGVYVVDEEDQKLQALIDVLKKDVEDLKQNLSKLLRIITDAMDNAKPCDTT
jgi:hypothetical protein